MRNPAFCLCENKGADQLSGTSATDQPLLVLLLIALLLKSKKIKPLAIVQPGLCRTWLEIPRQIFS